ncbi:MAG: response regulator [Candidatus Poribacteria bacterium]|jgi:hypothetical protein|nr:response regulator [Candidatus Poribacteria bacterium]MDP6747268.1 response regulator [Candidatus Poribacteria bacterium]MDP6994713.1 response regulator [Candidatus Poribacteria bacterium]
MDVVAIRGIVARHLQRLGCQVEEAVDGQQALEMFQTAEFDLILMDRQQMRQQEQTKGGEERTPILALTASVMERVTEQCRQAGMDAYYQQTVPKGGTAGGTPARG